MAGSMSGWDARRYARGAQIAVAVLGASAAFLWATDVTGMASLPTKPKAEPKPDHEVKMAAAVRTLDPDAVQGLAERLDLAGNVKPPPVAHVPPKDLPKDDPPPAGPEWTYLGPIFDGEQKLALISVDGHQKILAEGKKYGDMKLVSVARDEITVQGGGAAQHIHKADRKPNSSVSWVKAMPSNAPVGNTGVAVLTPNMGNQPGGMSPEMRQRLAERGINPDEMQRQRQQMRDRRNRARGADPGGGGPGTPFQGGGPQGSFTGAANSPVSVTVPMGGATQTRTQTGDMMTTTDVQVEAKRAAGGAAN